jgi:hydrogenase nickel incorporation protein HypB
MCTVCGCGTSSVEQKAGAEKALEEGHSHDHADGHEHGHDHHHHGHDHNHHDHAHPHSHDHAHDHDHAHGEGVIDFGAGIAGVHAPGLSQERIVRIERDILSKNDSYARRNRAHFAAEGVLALNLVSSPGSGKTTLLVRAIADLMKKLPVAVIEGDQQTSNDAERIRATGAPAIQINTGKGCHLDAHMVGHALETLDVKPGGVLFIENVGNLVCPAAFDLGEAHKIVVLSVTEGEDKPLKYPDMFAAADLMLLNKADLLPHLTFDVGACLANALRVNPNLQTLIVSAQTGEGLAAFYAWVEARAARAAAQAQASRTG